MVASPRRFGHSCCVRRFALNTIRSWHGRLLVSLLLCAVGFAGIPRLEVHSHADATPGHQHLQPLQRAHFEHDADAGATDTSAASSDEGGLPAPLHAHDISGLVHGLIAVAPPVVWSLGCVGLIPLTPVERFATWRTIPPHRPPIA